MRKSAATVAAMVVVAMVFASVASAQLSTGEIAFIAFNADGDDDFAIVLLTDVTDETIYFTDNESDGAGGLADANEGALQWDTGMAAIPAGTVVVFTDCDSPSNPSFGASVGTLTMPDQTFNLSVSGDGILAFQGTDELTPTTFLAGIENSAGDAGPLTGTGLVAGTTFLNFSSGPSDDGGEYTGARAGETEFSDYLALIHDPTNWTTANDGETLLPFDTTSFGIVPVELQSFSVD